ncbi:uncharacterized protein [Spinacia oleracea]|uniref:Uncharacterized protein isoform X2 n=1 Tax=Spinacia oleracea TaxID=3562 RepID=A0ABM3QRZ3_SPIOL|nr:uncharacterized protein LOC110778186 isoform X2 [Spinacia oleracea]
MTTCSLLNHLCNIASISISSQNPSDKFIFKTQHQIRNNINPRIPRPSRIKAVMSLSTEAADQSAKSMKNLLFVEMGVGYDQHGQDITAAAMRACRDAISSNSIPAFRRGSIPGVSFEQMKLQIKLGVPRCLQQSLDIEKVKSVFPYVF